MGKYSCRFCNGPCAYLSDNCRPRCGCGGLTRTEYCAYVAAHSDAALASARLWRCGFGKSKWDADVLISIRNPDVSSDDAIYPGVEVSQFSRADVSGTGLV